MQESLEAALVLEELPRLLGQLLPQSIRSCYRLSCGRDVRNQLHIHPRGGRDMLAQCVEASTFRPRPPNSCNSGWHGPSNFKTTSSCRLSNCRIGSQVERLSESFSSE